MTKGCLTGIALLIGSYAVTSCGSSSESGVATQATNTAAEPAGRQYAGRLAATLPLPVPRAFDLSHVEPHYFAAALGKDPVRIFNFVRDEVAFEPYTGSLRGARGTLLALAGNSADRASLLASLLSSSGHQVRFAHATLSDAQATDLVASIWGVPFLAEAPGERTAARASADEMKASIQRNSGLIVDALKQAGHPAKIAAAVTHQSLVAEARDHYWVEVLQDGTWVAMDPAFASATPGKSLAPAVERFATLPDRLFHRVAIKVRLEEYEGDKPSTRETLAYNAKAADLSAVDVFFAHQSGKGPEASRLTPVLVIGKQRIEGSAFWLKAPPSNAQAAALDALGGGGDEPGTGPVATAESIELEFTGPSRPRETVVREIFDRVGKKRRLNRETMTAEQVASSTQSVEPSEFSAGLYDLFFTAGAVNAAHLVTTQDKQSPDKTDKIDLTKALRALHIAFLAASDMVLSRLDDGAGRVCRFYLDTPRVHISDVTFSGAGARLSFDLRRDSARPVVTGFKPEHLFRAQVLRGVVDGSLERTLVDYLTASSLPANATAVQAMSTSLVFERANAEQVSTVLLARNGSPLPGDVAPDARARIEGALSGGSLVIAPARPIQVNGLPRMAWWQIDPRSGVTTAVTDEGLHQNTVELRITTDATGSTIQFTINGTRLPAVRTTMNGQQVRQWAFALGDRLLYDMRIWMTISGIWS